MIHEILPVGMLQCNCSILGDEETREAIVIDPGDEVERILAILKRHNLTAKYIINTHAHFDHVGNCRELKEATGAEIWLHKADLPIYESAPPGQEVLGYLPADDEWHSPNIYEDTANRSPVTAGGVQEGAQLPEHGVFFFYLARICNHCTYPACVAACPRKAIYKRDEDGIVLIDQSRCRGYRKCVEACPYKKPMYRPNLKVSEKCIACYPRLEGREPLTNGKPTVTRCVAACVGKIRLQGWIDDPASPIYYLVRRERVALPLYPQFGTEPNIYYIPPRWAPRKYLQQMFGPGVDRAIERYANPSHELLGVLQLFGATQALLFSYEVTDTEAIGFGEDGAEVVRVPIVERVIVRPERHLNIT